MDFMLAPEGPGGTERVAFLDKGSWNTRCPEVSDIRLQQQNDLTEPVPRWFILQGVMRTVSGIQQISAALQSAGIMPCQIKMWCMARSMWNPPAA